MRHCQLVHTLAARFIIEVDQSPALLSFLKENSVDARSKALSVRPYLHSTGHLDASHGSSAAPPFFSPLPLQTVAFLGHLGLCSGSCLRPPFLQLSPTRSVVHRRLMDAAAIASSAFAASSNACRPLLLVAVLPPSSYVHRGGRVHPSSYNCS
jgi:hypothetical protein